MKRPLPYVIFILVLSLAGVLFATRHAWAPRLTTLTQPDNQGLVFAVIGDTEGHADIYASAIRIAKEHGASFMIHTGDVSAEGEVDDLNRMSAVGKEAGLEIFSAVGNHDIRSDNSRNAFRQAFNEPNLAIDRGAYRFLILDNADRKVGFSDETLQFLKNEVAEHPQAEYVVVFHRPFHLPLAPILGDDETPTSRPTNDIFVDVMKDIRVAAIFTGHLHIYLPYSLNGMRTFVTGGGGGEAQAALGPLGDQAKHLLIVRQERGVLNVKIEKL